MKELIITLVATFVATLGYSIVFNIQKKDIFFASLGGMLTELCFIAAGNYTDNAFLLNFLSALFAAVYSELFARIRKTPANVFLFPCIIPLVPGGSLYYALLYAIRNNKPLFEQKATDTILAALGISFGIVVVSVAVKAFFGKIKTHKYNQEL